MDDQAQYRVAVVGAGPAGLFAARELAGHGVQVALFNRDIKPGGLAEYGIYPDKHKMKEGLRNQFRQIYSLPGVQYFGNITLGAPGGLSLADLRDLGFDAVLVTAGAQGTKWLGLPGENLQGVYHAKDLVYAYNRLPPFSAHKFAIGSRIAIIGMGNVMLDVSHYLTDRLHAEEVIAIARRGPCEVKFAKKELQETGSHLDLADLDGEIERVSSQMLALGQDPAEFREMMHHNLDKFHVEDAHSHFLLRFLGSPVRIIGNAQGHVVGLEVEDNTLSMQNDEVKARGTGKFHTLDVDTVIFAIGDQVDDQIGLPMSSGEFVKNPQPRFPVEGVSYELFDPRSGQPMDAFFAAGWSRKASYGLVGVARRDGVAGANAVWQYLQTLPLSNQPVMPRLKARLNALGSPVVTHTDLVRLEAAERDKAEQLGLEEYKFASNPEMLTVMGLLVEEK